MERLTTSEMAKVSGRSRKYFQNLAKTESWPFELEGQKKYYRLSSLSDEVRSLLSPAGGADPGDEKGASPDPAGDPSPSLAVVDAVGAAPTVEAEGEDKKSVAELKNWNRLPYIPIHETEIARVLKFIEFKSVRIIGKPGMGKTYVLRESVRRLRGKGLKVVELEDVPTHMTVLSNLSIACKVKLVDGLQRRENRSEMLESFRKYDGPPVILAFDQRGVNVTDTTMDVLDFLIRECPWFRVLAAGHFGQQGSRYPTWNLTQKVNVEPIYDERKQDILIKAVFPGCDDRMMDKISDESRGCPKRMVELARLGVQGSPIVEEERFLDATPFWVAVLIVFVAYNALKKYIGFAYNNDDLYVEGSVILSLFTAVGMIIFGYLRYRQHMQKK